MTDELCGFLRKDAAFDVNLCRKSNYLLHIPNDNLVPVRLSTESVSLRWLEKLISKEWKAHKENLDKDNYEWFECSAVEVDANENYAVGCEITTTYAGGRERTIVLNTKKEADAYSKKQKKKFGGCLICNRFKSMLLAVRKEAELGEKE